MKTQLLVSITSVLVLNAASAQNLFEADFVANKTNEFTPGGVQSTFASGAADLLGLAVQPVPEPSVFGFLAIGATALVLRRRSN